MNIKDRLKLVIKSSPLTQTEIAYKLKITPQAVQQWCDGSTTPKGTRLVALADLLDVKLDWLQTGRGETCPGGKGRFPDRFPDRIHGRDLVGKKPGRTRVRCAGHGR